jgi:hypothetical protein
MIKGCKCGAKLSKNRTRCKKCCAEYQWYWKAFKRFNLSRQEIEQMVKNQNGCCKICLKPFIGQRPCIDHCHTTNKVRGLLCNQCNTGLGLFYDNPVFLTSAIVYLNEPVSETACS